MRSRRRNASSSCRVPSCPSQESTCASLNVAAHTTTRPWLALLNRVPINNKLSLARVIASKSNGPGPPAVVMEFAPTMTNARARALSLSLSLSLPLFFSPSQSINPRQSLSITHSNTCMHVRHKHKAVHVTDHDAGRRRDTASSG